MRDVWCVERPIGRGATNWLNSICNKMCGATINLWIDRYCVERPLLCGATVIVWSDRYYVERPLLCGATVIVWSDRYCGERLITEKKTAVTTDQRTKIHISKRRISEDQKHNFGGLT